MAQGLPGADSFSLVTSNLIQGARNIFGQTPRFWGRYFKKTTASSPPEYSHRAEDAVLAQANIKVLPIAQQTTHVGGDKALGVADAQLNVTDFLATFPREHLIAQGGRFFMFLDVESDPETNSPSLSLNYYTGWGKTLTDFSRSETNNQVTLLPCVYARRKDNPTWTALVAANENGVKCHGAWVARVPKLGVCKTREYDAAFVTPTVPLPFNVLIWQYDHNCANKTIDLNQTNPTIADIQSALMSQLVLPPNVQP